jgi:hypothetical protein
MACPGLTAGPSCNRHVGADVAGCGNDDRGDHFVGDRYDERSGGGERGVFEDGRSRRIPVQRGHTLAGQ